MLPKGKRHPSAVEQKADDSYANSWTRSCGLSHQCQQDCKHTWDNHEGSDDLVAFARSNRTLLTEVAYPHSKLPQQGMGGLVETGLGFS